MLRLSRVLSFSLVSLQLSSSFFNDSATPEIYTLSLHDALPISAGKVTWFTEHPYFSPSPGVFTRNLAAGAQDRKSTRLNSSHANISYAVFCLKKKIPRVASTPERPSESRL